MGDDVVEFDHFGLVGGAVFEFDFVVGKAFIADDDTDGDADEVCVFEFDAGFFVAVIKQDFDTGGAELLVEVIGDLFHLFLVLNWCDDDVIGCDGHGPDDTVVIVTAGGFDGAGDDTVDTDPVAAHDGCGGFIVFILNGDVHGL